MTTGPGAVYWKWLHKVASGEGDASVFLIALTALWLTAIWDAWDTKRKARQAESVGEDAAVPA